MTLFVKGNTSILFLHVPKSGGTSVVEMFRGMGFSSQLEMRGLPPQPSLITSPQHMTCSGLRSIIRFDNLSDAFILVRCPYQRLRSEFNWCFRHTAVIDRPEFSKWVIDSLAQAAKNPFYEDSHFRAAIDYFDVDIPLKIFRLEDGIEFVAEFFLREPNQVRPVSVEHRNSSESFRQSGRNLKFNDAALAAVNEFYIYDFLAFNYKIADLGNPLGPNDCTSPSGLEPSLIAKANIVSRWRKETLLCLKQKLARKL